MKILILTSLFYPEIAANAKRMTHLAQGLKERGHDLCVITAFPYYSTKRDSKSYRGRWITEEVYDGIPVIRTYTYACDKYGNVYKRLWSFLSFMFSSIAGAFKIKGKVDVVVVISPPFFSIFSGYVISRMRRASLVLDIQDIYPETLIALGFLKNKPAVRILEWAERFFYRRAEGIAAISSGFGENFAKKKGSSRGIEVLTNWVDTKEFQPKDGESLREVYNLNGKFVVIFVGTIGFAQGLKSMVETARLLREEKDLAFVILGDGVERLQLEGLAREYGLSNLIFIPPQPNSEVPRFLSFADACLVHLKKNELYKITIPCKTYEYMAMGKPVIMGVKGEALKLVEECNCGIGVEPESPSEMALAILKLKRDKKSAVEMGIRGREHITANYDREKIVARYVEFLQECCRRK